ncbi:MAG TPA: aminotransferase [Gaiellaceae bacterium]|nr:aminotransferase [Gaiellaceae bacterium]
MPVSIKPTPAIEDVDRRYVFHPFTALRTHESDGGHVIVRGEGCTLWDAHGRSYLDAMAGLWCVNVGYGRRELAEAIARQIERLSYYHGFSSMATDTPALLAERVIELAPVPMSKVFFGNSGSDANDTQAKLVWFYNNALGRPAKKKIVSRERGYHGVTVLSAGLTGLANLHDGFDLPLPMIRHARAPHRLWEAEEGMSDAEFVAFLADDLEQLIVREGPETVAAFIAEPIQAAGGVIVPPPGYFAAVQEVLRRYDVLLIADEVVCGFGRLGSWFGSEPFELEPDLITVAKGLTSAYVPLSGCLVSEKVWSVVADATTSVFGHGYTYTAHPVAAAAALENLSIIERESLVEQAGRRGEYLRRRLREAFADHPLVGDVRGQGLIAAVEFVASRSPVRAFDRSLAVGARVTRKCLERGLITRALPAADTIAFSPPFVVSEEELDAMVERAREAADEVAAELGRG